MGLDWKGSVRELRPLVHLLLPLFVHWVAEEMTVSVLVDVTTGALCPGESTCSEAIYINGLQQTVVGIFKMVVLPILGQLADEYGRKPLLILTVSTTIVPFVLLAINESKASVYAYYVIRTISYIISQGSIFCISVAYVADVVNEGKRAALFSWITAFSYGESLRLCLDQVSIALLVFGPVYMYLFLIETVKQAPRHDQHSPWLHKAFRIVVDRYNSMRNAATIVLSSPTLKGMSLVSFFYELGMSGISSVLLLAARPCRDCLPPSSHHPWPIGAPTRPVEGHRAKRKPFEVKSTLIGVESSLVRSVSKQISHSHSPRRRLTVGSAFPTRSGRVSDEIGARFRRASEKEAPIRGSQGDSPPLCKIRATKNPFSSADENRLTVPFPPEKILCTW
ncbi:hypothetical protein Acr_18g0001870 [Actinidia rufa]|uniref:Major facilitator superfamily protein n=1 Tax=Actinidia rufa TaxID=165716 RepID=A0A7J0G5H0_9ERIC|nr:hypothetical protein Acr_18g0001870 [Actinidia rufa]